MDLQFGVPLDHLSLKGHCLIFIFKKWALTKSLANRFQKLNV